MKLRALVFLLLSVACSELRTAPSTPSGPVCGNGRLESGEQCEHDALRSATCASLGFGPGTLACGPGCRLDPSGCGAPSSCGNGTLEAPEVCDTAQTSTVTCVDLGFGPGTPSCAANCASFDTRACGPILTCGNGRREDPETCDGPQFGSSATCPAPARRVCSANCLEVSCVEPSDAGVSATRDASGGDDAAIAAPGADAAADPCAGVTCSGHGTCAVARGAALCVCDARFEAHALECLPVPTGAPTVTLTSRLASLAPTSQAIFEATVTDPDGLADVLGGELRAPTGESYGQFTRAGAGTFTIEVTWGQINGVLPINGMQGSTLTFVGAFFDAAGNTGSASVTVPIVCEDPPGDYLICSGQCSWNRDRNSCGACNVGCRRDSFSDECTAPGTCAALVNVAQDGPSCAAACTRNLGPNAHCVQAYGQGLDFHQQSPATCSTLPGDRAPNVDVTVTQTFCQCGSGSGTPVGNETCTQHCGAWPCQHTQVIFDHGDDAFTSCAPPYQILGTTVSTLLPNSTRVSAMDTYEWVDCTCEHPAD